MGVTIGVDVGGTKIAAGVVDADGNILQELRTESPAEDVAQIEQAIADLVGELRADHDVDAVGVGAAAFVDQKRARVLFAPNLAWKNLDLKGDLEKLLDLPVV